MAFDALDVASVGEVLVKGIPPTPIPAFTCTGMFAASTHALVKVTVRARFQAKDLLLLVLTTHPKMVAPAFSHNLDLLMGIKTGQSLTPSKVQLAVHTQRQIPQPCRFQ
jgi:hypothetical protein